MGLLHLALHTQPPGTAAAGRAVHDHTPDAWSPQFSELQDGLGWVR
jgi:hypothetical protein